MTFISKIVSKTAKPNIKIITAKADLEISIDTIFHKIKNRSN